MRKGETVFIVGERAVSLVDPLALEVAATIPLRSDERALVDDDDLPTELELSPDGKRAFVLYGLHNKVAVLDLEERAAIGSAKTGRRNKKLLAGLATGLQLAGFYRWWLGATGVAIDLADGYSHSARMTPRMLAVRPDGRFAYAINSQAKDVTVVDAGTAEAAEEIGGGGYELRFLRGGNVLAVLAHSEIHLLDTVENRKITELDVSERRLFESTPNESHIVVLGKHVVVCLDGATGEELSRLEDFVDPVALAFDSAPDHSSSRGSKGRLSTHRPPFQ
jgi:hypothetical protein